MGRHRFVEGKQDYWRSFRTDCCAWLDYEAAARIVSTVQQLSTVTLNMGTSGGY
jgi:hypothetical protein